MTFAEILQQTVDILQTRSRVGYRALQRQVALDDASLEDLKAELLSAYPQVVDEDNTLGWLYGELYNFDQARGFTRLFLKGLEYKSSSAIHGTVAPDVTAPMRLELVKLASPSVLFGAYSDPVSVCLASPWTDRPVYGAASDAGVWRAGREAGTAAEVPLPEALDCDAPPRWGR